jgi:hypothetical protein
MTTFFEDERENGRRDRDTSSAVEGETPGLSGDGERLLPRNNEGNGHVPDARDGNAPADVRTFDMEKKAPDPLPGHEKADVPETRNGQDDTARVDGAETHLSPAHADIKERRSPQRRSERPDGTAGGAAASPDQKPDAFLQGETAGKSHRATKGEEIVERSQHRENERREDGERIQTGRRNGKEAELPNQLKDGENPSDLPRSDGARTADDEREKTADRQKAHRQQASGRKRDVEPLPEPPHQRERTSGRSGNGADEAKSERVATREQRRQLAKERERQAEIARKAQRSGGEETSSRTARRRAKGRVFPIWLRLVIWIVLCIVGFVGGAMIGYGVLGDGHPTDVFRPATWTHIRDIIYKDQ